MPSDAASWRITGDTRGLLLATLVVLAGHAWLVPAMRPLVPAAAPPSRSPSSDVLLGAVPMPSSAERLERLSGRLPATPGVLVVPGRAETFASAYFVIAMRLWPRPVSLVACAPVPHVEQFLVPHAVPTPSWRIDLQPGTATPLRVGAAVSADPDTLCTARQGR